VTFPVRESDLPANTDKRWPGVDTSGARREGRPVARRFGSSVADDGGVQARDCRSAIAGSTRTASRRGFPFGFGLSYTTFALSNLVVTPRDANGTAPITVRVTVANTGRRRGAEVPQVYVSFPEGAGEPPKRLVAFEKVWLAPGERRVVTMTIDPAAASIRWGCGTKRRSGGR
jgi:beta-glucosidase